MNWTFGWIYRTNPTASDTVKKLQKPILKQECSILSSV